MTLIGRSRAAMRADTIARLVAAGTAAGSRVYGGRTTAYALADLPSISVYVSGETAIRRTQVRPPEWERQWTVELHCTVSGASDTAVDDATDALTDQVLAALVGDVGWGDDNQIERFAAYSIAKESSIEGDIRLMRAVIRIEVRAEMGQYTP